MAESRDFIRDRKRYGWAILVVALFGVVFLRSLSFACFDGDHAVSIAYHVLGRDEDLQPAYAAYEGMADVLLGVFPNREPIIRVASVLVSSLATICMMILLLTVVFQWIDGLAERGKWLVVLVVLLASPEFFYFGLIYSPSVIAMCPVLAAHLLLRRLARRAERVGLADPQSALLVVLSLGLFGLGVAFRWNILTYGAVIVTDWIVGGSKRHRDSLLPVRTRVAFGVLWGILALGSSAAAVVVSGYRATDVLAGLSGPAAFTVYRAGVFSTTGLTLSVYSLIPLLSLLTPAFVLLAVVGFGRLISRRSPLVIVVAVGILVVLPWIPSGMPKVLLPAIPGMVLCVATGFVETWYGIRRKKPRLLWQLAIGLLLVGPWVVGLQATTEWSAWGPAFEVRPYDRPETEGFHLSVSIGEGSAFPTDEGPRPLYGHAAVLLGGEWRGFVSEMAEESRHVVEQAISRDLPLLVTQWSPSFAVNELVTLGFTTDEPEVISYEHVTARHFLDEEGHQATLLYYEVESETPMDDVRVLCSIDDGDVVVIYGYSRTLRTLYHLAPDAFQGLGPTSAILDLDRLCEAVNMSPSSGQS